MYDQLLHDVRQYLPSLQGTQNELSLLFAQKLTATTTADSAELLRLAEVEARLVEQLRAHLQRRREILQRANAEGIETDSIARLVEQLDSTDRSALLAQVGEARDDAGRLRSQSWVQWIVSQRSLHHFAEMVELIAHSGRKSPVYDKQPNTDHAGGALLDASI